MSKAFFSAFLMDEDACFQWSDNSKEIFCTKRKSSISAHRSLYFSNTEGASEFTKERIPKAYLRRVSILLNDPIRWVETEFLDI